MIPMALTNVAHVQVHSKDQPLKVILESQYRPTQGNHVIEASGVRLPKSSYNQLCCMPGINVPHVHALS